MNTKSVDSNHAERDKHLRSDNFLDVEKFPQAKFASTSYTEGADGKAKLKGNLTLHGVTKEIEIEIEIDVDVAKLVQEKILGVASIEVLKGKRV